MCTLTSHSLRIAGVKMVYEWKDKVLLITGAARGIGSHIVRIALDEGVKRIVILDIDEANGVPLQNELNAKYGEGKVKFVKCDLTNEAQLTSSYKSVLSDKNNEYAIVHCAAILNDSWATYRKQVDINVTALMTGSLVALDMMRADKGGKGGAIINIASVAALMVSPFTPIYSATKSAVMHFSVSLGASDFYDRTHVRVITMCFGVTDTGLIDLKNMGSFDELMESRFEEALGIHPGQKAQSAARSVIDSYKLGASGSVWLSNADKPAEDITDKHTEAYRILSEPVLIV